MSARLLLFGLMLGMISGCAQETVLTQADVRLYGGRFRTDRLVATDSLRCVSYNIQFSERLDQALKDLTSISDLHQPDVIFLQEMNAQGAEFLARRLGMNYYYHPSFISPHHGDLFGNAVLSPWPLSHPHNVVLPHPNPMTENRRSALAVDVQIGEHLLRAVSVHLATMVVDQAGRVEQLEVVRDSLLQEAGPMVLGGDFNSGTRYETFLFSRVMRQAGFHEARMPWTRTASGGPLDLVGYQLKLDHFFFKNLEFVRAGIADEARASDHLPIWSVFHWGANAPR